MIVMGVSFATWRVITRSEDVTIVFMSKGTNASVVLVF